MTRSTRTRRALTALLSLLPRAAYAHHAMDYEAPAHLLEGFVSGLAHPVIGLDHLLFVIAIGAACYFFGRRAASPALFIAGHDWRNRAASPAVLTAPTCVRDYSRRYT
jgi:urease accessory protein